MSFMANHVSSPISRSITTFYNAQNAYVAVSRESIVNEGRKIEFAKGADIPSSHIRQL